MEAQLDAVFRGFGGGKLYKLEPLPAVVDDAAGRMQPHIHSELAADAHVGECLQIGANAFAGDVAVHPIPIDPRPDLGRRLGESFGKRIGLASRGGRSDETHVQPDYRRHKK